ncbi:MAG: chalcone isomerase family protein [Gammaproteobacteria bacterium]
MQKLISGLLGILLLTSTTALSARELSDIEFPEQLVLPGTDQLLRLNGIGYRSKFFIKVYIAALYTERQAKTRDDVQAQTGPRRLLMHFVYDEVEREKLVKAWNEGFEDNTSEETFKSLRPRIDKFNAMFPNVYEGDVVLLDYIPGKGTVVTIKGEEKGVIEGADFNRALMDIWLGDEPVDSGLKDALLGD